MILFGKITKESSIVPLEPVQFPDGKSYSAIPKNKISGSIPHIENVLYRFSYCFLENGMLRIYDSEEITPASDEEFIQYIGSFSGIGMSAAKRVFSAFGHFFFDMMLCNPKALEEVEGFNEDRVKKAEISVLSRRNAKDFFSFLRKLNVSDEQIIETYRNCFFDNKTLADLRKAPYPYLPFEYADKVAVEQDLDMESDMRFKAGILEVLRQVENGGDLITNENGFPEFCEEYLTFEELSFIGKGTLHRISGSTCIKIDYLRLLLIKLTEEKISIKKLYELIVELIRENKVKLASVRGKKHLYRKETYDMETAASRLITMFADNKYEHLPTIYRKINHAEALLGIKLSNQQTDAVRMAIENHISVLTGGPGTGKTSVQKTLISVFKEMYPQKSIILCAPTGKAAKRMGESTGYPASTIHRLLGLLNGSDEREIMNNRKTISDSLIICDETSMLDNAIFYCLMKSIGAGNHLLLVGDTAQLPSIGAGTVLKNLIESKKVAVTNLTKTFRQGDRSIIPINAARIKNGEDHLETGDEFQVISAGNSDKIAEIATDTMVKAIKEDGISNVVCLTAYKRTTITGSNSLNEMIRSRLRNNLAGVPYFTSNDVKIYEGDIVMYTRNSNGLTNGDTGIVKKVVCENGHQNATCDFDGTVVTLSDETLDALELAYAMTIHKSQGSEYKTVILVIDKAHEKLLNRSIIFTGLTRAKQRCILVQPDDNGKTTKHCIHKLDLGLRETGLLA